jgi:hypothetical protein
MPPSTSSIANLSDLQSTHASKRPILSRSTDLIGILASAVPQAASISNSKPPFEHPVFADRAPQPRYLACVACGCPWQLAVQADNGLIRARELYDTNSERIVCPPEKLRLSLASIIPAHQVVGAPRQLNPYFRAQLARSLISCGFVMTYDPSSRAKGSSSSFFFEIAAFLTKY